MQQVYRVIMFPSSCPSEVSSLGVYLSEHAAEVVIEKEKKNHSDDMVFDIEIDYIG